MIARRLCQWTNLDEAIDEGAPAIRCFNEASFTTCDPVGGVVCDLHRCRCSKPLPAPRCTARVWDNGDTTDCGSPAVRSDRCQECLDREVERLRLRLLEIDDEARKMKARLAVLGFPESPS